MAETKRPELRTDPDGHPAVEAWRRLRPDGGTPGQIQLLKKKPKSLVYRLSGAGPDGTGVIAKRSRGRSALFEHRIYAEILPATPVTSVRSYGCVEDPGGAFSWLFLEDAGVETYAPDRPEQRALAARWLGLLHTSAANHPLAARLPDRGPNWYLAHLRSARERILEYRFDLALEADELETLERVLSQCDFLESHWHDLTDFCERLPHTLVHGDFVAKNICVRAEATGAAVLPLDWEQAGWGVPAADLFRVDMATYRSTVRPHWPSLDEVILDQLANLSQIFRDLASFNWESLSLCLPHSKTRAMEKLKVYSTRLTGAIEGRVLKRCIKPAAPNR